MPHADPSQSSWEPADDLDRILYDVWCKALDASQSKDQQEEIHDCSVCGDSHGHLDEAKYVEMQRAYLSKARHRLDTILAEGKMARVSEPDPADDEGSNP